MPGHLAFTNEDTFDTNAVYSHGEVLPVVADPGMIPAGAAFNNRQRNFEFVGGVAYPDVIVFNFTVTSDPDGDRGPGSGPADAFVLVSPLCHQTIINGFPAAGAEVRQCGATASAMVIVEIEGSSCYIAAYIFSKQYLCTLFWQNAMSLS
jgi:hypothetical protein